MAALAPARRAEEGPARDANALSDELIQRVVAFMFEKVLGILDIAVVSRQFNTAVQRAAVKAATGDAEFSALDWHERLDDASFLFTDRMASNFARWPQLGLAGGPSSGAPGIEIPEDDALVYHCRHCRSPLLRVRDIVSTNYHGAHGPAFLVNHLYNASVEKASYEASFVTGCYQVSDVTCGTCRLQLGKKYVQAHDAENRFKEGKYLLEQTMVFVPKCCSGGFRDCEPGYRVCMRCSAHLCSRTAQAMLLVTGGFRPNLSHTLLKALEQESALLQPAGVEPDTSSPLKCPPEAADEGSSASYSAADFRRRSGCRACQRHRHLHATSCVCGGVRAAGRSGSLPPTAGGSSGSQNHAPSWQAREGADQDRMADQETQHVGAARILGVLGWKLGRMCEELPSGVEAALLLSFAERVAASAMVSSFNNCGRDRDEPAGPSGRGRSDSPAARLEPGDHWSAATGERRPARHPEPGVRSRRSLEVLRTASARGSSRRALSREEAETRGNAASHSTHRLTAAGVAANTPTAGSEDEAPLDVLRVRIARWVVVQPALLALSADLPGARRLLRALLAAWQPCWPAERPSAERLIDGLVEKLDLDDEERGDLWEALGIKKPKKKGFCSWFPFFRQR